jgi:hypothetical protein
MEGKRDGRKDKQTWRQTWGFQTDTRVALVRAGLKIMAKAVLTSDLLVACLTSFWVSSESSSDDWTDGPGANDRQPNDRLPISGPSAFSDTSQGARRNHLPSLPFRGIPNGSFDTNLQVIR